MSWEEKGAQEMAAAVVHAWTGDPPPQECGFTGEEKHPSPGVSKL